MLWHDRDRIAVTRLSLGGRPPSCSNESTDSGAVMMSPWPAASVETGVRTDGTGCRRRGDSGLEGGGGSAEDSGSVLKTLTAVLPDVGDQLTLLTDAKNNALTTVMLAE